MEKNYITGNNMILYISIIIVSMITICMANYFIAIRLFNFNLHYIIFSVIYLTIAVIIVDGMFAFCIRWLFPKKWFSVDKKFYVAKKTERKIYEKIGIKRWKDKVLELGGFTKFNKNKLGNPKDSAYVRRFIVESNYGVAIHISCMCFGYLIIFLHTLEYCLCFAIPVATVNMILNALPCFILRYNLSKLHVLNRYNQKKEKSMEINSSNSQKNVA